MTMEKMIQIKRTAAGQRLRTFLHPKKSTLTSNQRIQSSCRILTGLSLSLSTTSPGMKSSLESSLPKSATESTRALSETSRLSSRMFQAERTSSGSTSQVNGMSHSASFSAPSLMSAKHRTRRYYSKPLMIKTKGAATATSNASASVVVSTTLSRATLQRVSQRTIALMVDGYIQSARETLKI